MRNIVHKVLDLKSLTWSKIEAKMATATVESSAPSTVAPYAGHSLISWGNKILSIAGHTKDPCETVTVKEFDPQTCTWSNLKTYGKPPISRGGQSVTLVGGTLVMFGGQDAKRNLLNDLHILDLETMTDIDAIGTPPSPRSDHSAACHAERYLLIFGGGSHATCFNDLHVLDLQNMEWSGPKQQGVTPAPRAGHAGITVGENWFIVGGGDNKNEQRTLNTSIFRTINFHAIQRSGCDSDTIFLSIKRVHFITTSVPPSEDQPIFDKLKRMHGASIMEMNSTINLFQRKNMDELIKFHQLVELELENLTDETQVLARFEGFPCKKLENIRMAVALYSKLNAMVTTLKSWKMVSPTVQQLDKVECSFNKEVDAIEAKKKTQNDSKAIILIWTSLSLYKSKNLRLTCRQTA